MTFQFNFIVPRTLLPAAVVCGLVFLGGCCTEEKAKALRSKLYSAKASERSDAASSLAYCGSKAESAVPRLAQLLYDENSGVQSMAAYALRKIDTPSARAIMKRVDESRRR